MKDLTAAKQELAVKKKATRKEFAVHLAVFRSNAGSYVLKKVMLPLGATAVAAFAVKYFFFSQETSNEKVYQGNTAAQTEKAGNNKWLSYLSILLSIVKTYNSIFKGGGASKREHNAEDTLSPKNFVKTYREESIPQESFEATASS